MTITDIGYRFDGYAAWQLAKCAQREVRRRKQKYPGYVLTHRMKQQEADNELRMMTAIAEHFIELAKGERLL